MLIGYRSEVARKTSARFPAVGGGPSLVVVLGDIPPANVDLVPDAEKWGAKLVATLRRDCEKSKNLTNYDVERLVTLRTLFPAVMPRIPELHVLMDRLICDNRVRDANRILPRITSQRRGRPPEDLFYWVSTIEIGCEIWWSMNGNKDRSWVAAVGKVKELAQRDGFQLPSAKRLQNALSQLREYVQIHARPVYVSGDLLTPTPWSWSQSNS